jgi:hypothetical protein
MDNDDGSTPLSFALIAENNLNVEKEFLSKTCS